MRIATITASISRQGGGLVESVYRLAQALQNLGNTLEVYTVEDKRTDADFAAWKPFGLQVFPRRGPSRFSFGRGLKNALCGSQCDILLSHGLWRYTSCAALAWHRVTGNPYVVHPHGMLDPWAIQHSRWRKQAASLLYEREHLRSAACIRVLCEAEAKAVRDYGLNNPICVIPNGIDPPPPEALDDAAVPWQSNPAFADKRILLSLGRIHPKKNLAELLRAWSAASSATNSRLREWILVIAGWDELGYEAELKELADQLNLRNRVYFAGPLFDQAKAATFRAASAFVISSLSEGMPIVVLEAWANKLPVLMTPECNLPEGFDANAAISMGGDRMSIAKALRSLGACTSEELTAIGMRGKILTEQKFSWTRVGRQMHDVLLWIRGERETPECVRR